MERAMKTATKSVVPVLLLTLVLASLLSGCDRWAAVETGLYAARAATREQTEMMTLEPDRPSPWIADSGIATIFVDRDHEVAWLFFDDGSLQILAFTARSRETWPEGCPANLGSTRMEVLDLAVEALRLPPATSPAAAEAVTVTVDQPVLIRDCPPDPVELVLRDGGETGGGVACVGAESCLELEFASSDLTLPDAMKGYELYRWREHEDGPTRHTLMTGTNRNKTRDEITAPGSAITGDGWVKITVEGEAALASVLDRLPEGAEVVRYELSAAPDG